MPAPPDAATGSKIARSPRGFRGRRRNKGAACRAAHIPPIQCGRLSASALYVQAQSFRLNFIARRWSNIRHLREGGIEFFAARPPGALIKVILGEPAGNFFRHGGADKLGEGHAILGGKFACFLFERVRQFDIYRSHIFVSNFRRNSAGVNTPMPNCSAPTKSRTLCVTMKFARTATASSKIMSSSASRKNGRHE